MEDAGKTHLKDTMGIRQARGRRVLGRFRRGKLDRPERSETDALALPPRRSQTMLAAAAGWDRSIAAEAAADPAREPSLRARVLSLFADPRYDGITAHGAARALEVPLQDVQTTLDAMVQAGELAATDGPVRRYEIDGPQKAHLEAMFREAAVELGEHAFLSRTQAAPDTLASLDDDTDEPRLPVTAGLLSLFLPGTGQLLNGDVGRASLVFSVWALAWITQLSPVCAFVQLYAGAEAFFTAKIRTMERRMAREAASRSRTALPTTPTRAALPPKVPSSG